LGVGNLQISVTFGISEVLGKSQGLLLPFYNSSILAKFLAKFLAMVANAGTKGTMKSSIIYL